MTVKRPPYAIKSKNPQYTEALLRDLLDAPESEQLHGIALAGVTADDRLVLKISGRFMHKPKEAYWAVGVLHDELRKMIPS